MSTPRQASDSRFGVDVQLRAIREYATRRGLTLNHDYIDTVSGTMETREALDTLLRDAPNYEAVIVYHVDRLARDTQLSYKILSELQESGLTVHSTTHGVVRRGLLFAVESAMSEEWLERHKQKTHGGMIAKARRGRAPRPINAYGFLNGFPLPEEAAIAARIFRELERDGLQQVASRLNADNVPPPLVRGRRGKAWRPSTLRAIVENPALKGEAAFGRAVKCYVCEGVRYNYSLTKEPPMCCGERMIRERVTVPCEVIVSPEQWARTNAAIERRNTNRSRRGSRLERFPLTGRMTCGLCGGAMSAQPARRGGPDLYYCARRRQHKQHPPPRCEHGTYHNAGELHADIHAHLLAWLTTEGDAALERAVGTPEPIPVRAVDARARLLSERERWKAAILAGVLPLPEIKIEIDRVDALLAALPPERAPVRPERRGAAEVREALRARAGEPLHVLLDAVGARVVLHPDGGADVTV